MIWVEMELNSIISTMIFLTKSLATVCALVKDAQYDLNIRKVRIYA